MGILSRKQGEEFVITSDRTPGESTVNRAPKKALLDVYQIWTGDKWSSTMTDAKTFPTMDNADDYVRANIVKIMK